MEEKDVHEIRDLTGLEEEEPLKLKKRKKDLLDEISSIQNGFLKKKFTERHYRVLQKGENIIIRRRRRRKKINGGFQEGFSYHGV